MATQEKREIYLSSLLAHLLDDFCQIHKTAPSDVIRSLQARFYADLVSGWENVEEKSGLVLTGYKQGSFFEEVDVLL